MTTRIAIRLPQDLPDRAGSKATAEGRTLTSLIADGLLLATGATKPARMPRVSKAAGGLMPGVDPGSFAALQEKADVKLSQQMKNAK